MLLFVQHSMGSAQDFGTNGFGEQRKFMRVRTNAQRRQSLFCLYMDIDEVLAKI